MAQMENAIRLRFDLAPAPGEPDPAIPDDSVLYASMRQGLGLIVVAALIAGALPFLWNWISAARMGAAVPLAKFEEAALAFPGLDRAGVESVVDTVVQTIAGLPPAVFPAWMASGISALGIWINTPLQWMFWWIVYGLAVLLVAKMLGATTTLQQFYTVTSFGFLPLVLTAFNPIPCLGAVITVIAFLWAFVVYVGCVRSATRLSLGMSFLATALPAATIILLSIVVAVATAATVAGVLL
jgi:hypothetical protein